MLAEPASASRPSTTKWGCHDCPPTVCRALVFTGELWELFGLTTAHVTPGSSCELNPHETCKILVLANSDW